ncbi:hypothetical protein ABI59_12705 [Acidobacteria bacterium Mor1]|nr:hypothetical protein ABI59_12705 [Acidobacteria bacterium Mor1]
MVRSPSRVAIALCGAIVVAALSVGPASTPIWAKAELRRTLEFAAEMAEAGNWREAQFRWEKAQRLEGEDNFRVINNLAVAAEVLGNNAKARDLYETALAMSGGNERISENVFRFERFERLRREVEEAEQDADAAGEAAASEEPELEALPPELDPRKRKKPKKKERVRRVAASFRLPARLNIEPYKTILVASFRTEDDDLLDSNREITRYLRSAFGRRSTLEALEVAPAPAIPEQTLEDMIRNGEFWKYLGKEYGADLVVSGLVRYTNRDASGFEDVDVVSPVTGQKVRRTQFVEREQFVYEMDLLFFDGATGQLVFRDKLRRGVVYQGTANDALTAFHDLVELISREVMSVVSPRTRQDSRFIFKE